MQKLKYIAVTLPLIAILLLVTPAKAVAVSIDVTPTKILPGGTVSIEISADTAGAPTSFSVVDPFGGIDPYSGPAILFPDTVTVTYPTDFTGGSTTDMGVYTITLVILGVGYVAGFLVSFFVIPESPIGTLLGIIAPAAAVTSIFAAKRLKIPKKP